MSGVYKLSIHWRSQTAQRRASARDARWSLTAVDPADGMVAGTLRAADGAILPYRLWQSRTEPPRALLILLHGACDYSGAFDEIGPVLAARGFTALAYDQRGFGGSRARGKWRGTKRMAGDVGDVVKYMRLRFGDTLPVFLLGESMGAAIAVLAAADNAALNVQGLVLAAPGALAGLFRRLVLGALLRAISWFAPNSELVCERLSGPELTPSSTIRLLMDPMVLRTVRPKMLFGLAHLGRRAVDVADRVTMPVLTMAGGKDDIMRLGCINALHARFAGQKEAIVFDGAPHLLLHWEQHEKVLDRVTAWLEERLAVS